MYTTIRRYNIRPDSMPEIIQRAENGFIPIVSKAPGFLSYDLVNTGHNTLITISTFEDRAGADHSNKLAEGWVRDNLESMITEPPTILGGETGIHKAK
jgi:quinol monooxygenase YgiN